MEKTLHLPLKAKWYRMIESGEKKEEYREINPYWHKRFMWCNNECDGYNVLNGSLMCCICKYKRYKKYEFVEFTLGYPRKDDLTRRMTFKIENFKIDTGKPEWGAEEETEYFVIEIGERIK